MKEIKHIKAIKVLLGKDLKKNTFKPCDDFNPDCASCRFYILDGLLRWYLDVLK